MIVEELPLYNASRITPTLEVGKELSWLDVLLQVIEKGGKVNVNTVLNTKSVLMRVELLTLTGYDPALNGDGESG